MAAQVESLKMLMSLGTAGIFGIFLVKNCFFTVEPGHCAIKFSKFFGLQEEKYKEGWHFRIPYFETPIDYNIQTRPRQIKANTANRDMQNVLLTLRVLHRPYSDDLPTIYRTLGIDYDEKVLPSIVNETMRSVVAQYTASQLMSQRDQVSFKIRQALDQRAAQFKIAIDDVSITELTFGKEYLDAVEAKQVAQQEAERAKFVVEQAREAKKSIVIKALGEAKSIELVGKSALTNPAFLDVRRIEYAREISAILAESRNHIMLPSDILKMDATAHK
ncbi:unnamed protein product [Paramecium primaurelia]|uniref:Prohibitin n=3 Tax=Paramecium TaxID=5884 RepID=A0A8S1U4X5_PAROT|nr:unnamed protein product [Paramecium primaurelia]CAD8134656.1 unnamed protein product [Paramecium pentaurelia]CAD8159142.1 unnamed protein product [Paramecium octaurelia]